MNGDRNVIDWIAGYLPPAEKWHRKIQAELLLVDGKPGEALTAIDKAMSLTKRKDSLARFDAVKKKIKEALAKK